VRGIGIYLVACCLAALAPLTHYEGADKTGQAEFIGWPVQFEGRSLKQEPLSKRENRFASGFPGRIAKFTDGDRMLIMRWATRKTRKLHPASDCFRGSGYRVKPLPIHVDRSGAQWGCFEGERDGHKVSVRERMFDSEGNGWTDVSAWYWAAFLGRSHGPWWAVTVVENLD
jgi:hypothetical protein